MAVNMNDSRFKAVEEDKKQALNNVNNTYNNMISQNDKFYKDQQNLIKDYETTQKEIQQQQTDFTIEKINQQKDQAKQDYTKEQKASYVDYQKQSNQFGANAEAMASRGLNYTGYAESSQVSMYNTYQNRYATARETYNRAVLNYISLAEKNRIPINVKYYNPRVIYDGYRFYIVVSVDDENAPIKKSKELENKTIGIDVNISSIVTSENKVYVSVNKEKKVKKAVRKLKRKQRSLSRKYEVAKKEKRKLKECKNFIKNKKTNRVLLERINNLRNDYIEKVIEDILIKPPRKIVVEDLDVKSMQQNKKISSLIQISSFTKFINKLIEKCSKHNIEIIKTNRYYPSSKMCSKCKNIKEKLLLSERVYKCSNCNNKINRDYNAAINLANYI